MADRERDHKAPPAWFSMQDAVIDALAAYMAARITTLTYVDIRSNPMAMSRIADKAREAMIEFRGGMVSLFGTGVLTTFPVVLPFISRVHGDPVHVEFVLSRDEYLLVCRSLHP